MQTNLNRRDWLRSAGLLSAGVAVAGLNTTEASAMPMFSPEASGNFVNEFGFFGPPDIMPKLRARLFANENPLGISQKAKEALLKATDIGNRYAWMEFKQLKTMIATDEGVTDKNILCSPGSSDILLAAAAHYGKNGGTILTCRPTYDDLLERAEAFGAKIVAVPLTDKFEYDLDAMKAKITPDVKMVYIVNPNNPTGTIVDAAKLEVFCREVAPKVPVFVDEAYIDFFAPADRPKLGKLVAEGLNLILARTFSKIHGFAGLRLGYAIALPDTLKVLKQYTNGDFGVSITTLMAGIASYQDKDWQNYCRAENAKAREFTASALKNMGYDVIPSHTNFMLFPIKMKTKAFENQMFGQGIGIQTRDIDRQPYCRVSIGTITEMEAFMDGFKKVVSG
jgi:histidinol-phosphate aminotransferase